VIIMAVNVPVQQLPDRPLPDGQRPPDRLPLPFGQRLAAWLLKNRGMQAFYGTLLLGTVAAALLPAVIFQPHRPDLPAEARGHCVVRVDARLAVRPVRQVQGAQPVRRIRHQPVPAAHRPLSQSARAAKTH
jgi:hypothetical protein